MKNQADKKVLRVDQDWTESQINRRNKILEGLAVVASQRRSKGEGVDAALISWAEQNGKLVLVDRKTIWGNPFEMPKDGDRYTVCDKYEKHYLPYQPSLLSNLPELRGKVLLCWCFSSRCHADTLANLVNEKEL